MSGNDRLSPAKFVLKNSSSKNVGDPEALRLSEERQAFLLKLSDAIRRMGDPARILAEACRLLGTRLRVSRVAYGEIDGDECTFIADYVDRGASVAGRVPWTT